MMTLRRIFGLMLLFLFFEAVVAVVCTFAYPDVNVFLACVAMTGLALAVWAVFVVMTRWMMRPRVPPPPPAPRANTPSAPRAASHDDPFTQELNALIAEADRRLSGSLPRNSRGQVASVATLPLYLVVGGEGSGKTSAIARSGLDLRLLAGEAAREENVVPTRLCNIWFADGAIFADISGRVFTQEADNWERCLRVFSRQQRVPAWKRLFRAQKSQANLRGILLACDASLFVRASDQQRSAALARTLNERLRVAAMILRREFPVYLLFTKSDGIAYFKEFFSHLSEPEGRRLLGVTLPYVRHRNDTAEIYADREGKRLTDYFNRLYMALAEKRLIFLAREDSVPKRSGAYEFPRELKKLRGDLIQFLLDTFRPDPLQPGARLRGFYLSGQRWITRTVDPVADSGAGRYTVAPKRSDATVFFGLRTDLGSDAGVDNARGGGKGGAIPKSVFLADLLRNVVLKDRAGEVTAPANLQDQTYGSLILAGAGALLLLFCLLWANSWRHNRELLKNVQAAVETIPAFQQATSSGEAVLQLDAIRQPLSQLLQYDRQHPPLSYRWGLYSGADVLAPLSELYFVRFRVALMDPMLQWLTTHFLQLRPNVVVGDDVYGLLKTYRMVTSGECKPNSGFLNQSLPQVWNTAASFPASDSAAMADKQLQFYVQELMIRNPYQRQITENDAAIGNAQTYLRSLQGPDRILRALVEEINTQQRGDSLSNYAPNYGMVLTGPDSIDFAYSRGGWDAVMDNIRGHKLTSGTEACVVGEGSEIAGMTFTNANEREVQELYVDGYIAHWKDFIGAHHVEPFRGSADAAQKLRVLADNNRSPLLGLVYMVSHNTDLSAAHSGESTAHALAEGMKAGAKKQLSDLVNKMGGNSAQANQAAAQLAPSALPGAQDVLREFQPAYVVVSPKQPDKWLNSANQAYMQALEDLGQAIGQLPDRIDNADPASKAAVDKATNALNAARAAHHAMGATIPNYSSGVDIQLESLLGEPINYAGKVIASVPVKPPPPPPPDATIPIKKNVNAAAQALCTSANSLRTKYPFSATATQDATIQDLNEIFAPGTGSLAQFVQTPDVAKVYLRQGHAWVQNPSFPGTFSQPFLDSLNNLLGFADALYSDGSNSPHFDYIVYLDGTGRVPAQLDVDGHIVAYNPKKGPASTRLVWPPTTGVATKLTVKAAQPLPIQDSGIWGLFRLLQAADKQEGNVFVFSMIQFANGSKVQLQDGKGNPVTVQIRIDSPTANSIFGRNYLTNLRCDSGWAVR